MDMPPAFRQLRGLRRSGEGYFAQCPFHPDRNPSLHISWVGGRWLWFCFGCGAGGDEHDFLQRIGEGEEEKEIEHAPWARVLERAWAAWEGKEGILGKIYLSLRGVSEEAQEAFRVGWVKGKGIAIPLHSAPQRVCGVKIRHLEGPTRYTSLKGSKEGAVAPWGMQGLPTLVVVEGALDAMVAFPEVKALGAEVIACRSVEVIERFARGASRVVVWMDEDEAGERFAQKILTHLGARAERVPRTGFKDPAELAHAAARGKAPSIREVLEPLIGRRMPAWVALWEALAREGEIEPPPVKVPEEEVRRAQRALQYLPRGIAAGRVRQMREQARALLAEISKERGEDGG